MEKTFNDFIKNHSSNPELHKKVFQQGGVSFDDFKDNPNDYYAANTGSVPGMIYFSDTINFAKNNVWLILDELIRFESEVSKLEKPEDDLESLQNWLTWFAWENMASELIDYIEQE